MKQEILDKLARLHYEDEKRHVKRLKTLLNDKVFPADPERRETYLALLRYHKERLIYHKRQVPLKPAKQEDALWDLDVCPCCRSVARLYKNCCEECGQRLMWSNENGKV